MPRGKAEAGMRFCRAGLRMRLCRLFWHAGNGGTAVEYALLAGLVALVGFTGFMAFGDSIGELYGHILTHAGNALL